MTVLESVERMAPRPTAPTNAERELARVRGLIREVVEHGALSVNDGRDMKPYLMSRRFWDRLVAAARTTEGR